MHKPRVIDALVPAFTPEALERQPSPDADKELTGIVGSRGISLERMIERMDLAGVDVGVLTAVRGSASVQRGATGTMLDAATFEVPYDVVKNAIDQYPDRFVGVAGVSPEKGMAGVRELEDAIMNYGFKAAHVFPHWVGRPPNDRIYYPFYAKCVELDIPFVIGQVRGTLLKFTPLYPLHPLHVDDVAMDFPELRIVCNHAAWPWADEMVAVLVKHPNVYHVTATCYPKTHWKHPGDWRTDTVWGQARLDQIIIDYMKADMGKSQVIFGSNFPVFDVKAQIDEFAELDITPEKFPEFFGKNAENVFRI